MHCLACAQEIKRRIHRMQGVESVDPDLKSSQVTVRGAIDPAALVEYVHRRTGKHAAIVKEEPENLTPENNSEEPAKENKEEKKADAGEGAESEKKADEETKVEEKAADGEAQGAANPAAEEAVKVVEVKKNEYQSYPQRYIMEMYPYPPAMNGEVAYPAPHSVVEAYPPPVIGHPYPPQMFSDENPNACSVM